MREQGQGLQGLAVLLVVWGTACAALDCPDDQVEVAGQCTSAEVLAQREADASARSAANGGKKPQSATEAGADAATGADPAAGADPQDNASTPSGVGKLCTPSQTTCEGNVLTTCSEDGTRFEKQMACGRATCDVEGADCNVCKPGSLMCDGDLVMTCDETGQDLQPQPCPTGRHCIGEGQCLECGTDAHCAALTMNCQVGSCSQNRCAPRIAPNDTECKLMGQAGSCSNGRCVLCKTSMDCTGGSADGCRVASCQAGVCAVAPARDGVRCSTGVGTCRTGRCCMPACTGRCGGADNGCGGTCTASCPSGQVCNTSTKRCGAAT